MRLLAVLMLLLVNTLVWAEDSDDTWVLDNNRDGITSYTRKVPGQDTLDFRAIIHVKCDFQTAVTALADVEHYPDWFWHMEQTKILADKDLDNLYMYLRIEGIPPVKDRDVVIKAEMWQDPITMELNMEGHSSDSSMVATKSGVVRIPFMTAGFKVKPISQSVTEIELSGTVDPGGAIPVWAANMVITVLPRVSLDNLRSKLSKSEYRDYLRTGRQNDQRWARLFRDFRFTTPVSDAR